MSNQSTEKAHTCNEPCSQCGKYDCGAEPCRCSAGGQSDG